MSWTGHPGQRRSRQDKQPRTHTFVSKISVGVITLTVMFSFLVCEKKQEETEGTQACTRKTCKLQARTEPGPSCCKVMVQLTMLVCSPAVKKLKA